MVKAVEEVLKNMGWDNGFHLPVANVENQALEKEIERLMFLKGQTCVKLELTTNKYNNLTKHLSHLNEEQSENQKIIMAEQSHIDEQRTKQKVLLSEKEKLQQEVRSMEKEYKNVQQRIEARRSDLTRVINKIEKLKTESAWDAEALAAWDEALAKRQIDNEMIKKFSTEDEKKTIELETKRCQLQTEYNQKREEVHHMASDLTHHELVLERTSKYYRQLQAERTALIRQWQDSVNHLKQRDSDISKLHLDINVIEEAIQFKLCSLEDRNEFLQNEIGNNKELEDEIADLNIKASRIRKHNMVLVDTVQTYIAEANTLKRQVTNAAQSLETLRESRKNISKKIADKEKEVKCLRKKNEELKKKLKDIANNSSSAAERANQLENMIKALQKEKDVLIMDIEANQNLLFRQQQMLNAIKEKETEYTMKISGVEISSNLLRKNVTDLNNDLSKQKEVIYDLDYRLHFLQSKIMDVNTTRSDYEKEAFDENISKLESRLEELNEVKHMLDKQILCIEDEMRRLTQEMAHDRDSQILLKNKLQHELLLSEGGQKQVSNAKQRCQHRQVQENILYLRVNQTNKALRRKDDTIFTLKKCKLEMAMALRQREIEISTQKDIMLVKRRNLYEEKGRLKMDITCRLNRIEQHKSRYTIIINSLGKSDEGNQFTITHFKIKLSQERLMLQQQGDALDQKIKTAEKEIEAMENTLKIVNLTNDTYKQSLSAVEDSSADLEEMARLEQDLSDKTQELYRQKGIQNQYKKVISDKEQSMKNVCNRYQNVQEILQSHELELTELRRDALDREEKILRAQHQLRKLIRNYQNADKLPKVDAHVRTLQDLNRNILQQLREMSSSYLEIAPLVTRYFKEQQIIVPSTSRLYILPSPSSSDKSVKSDFSSISQISTEVNSSASSCSSMKSIPSVTISFESTVPVAASSKTSQGEKERISKTKLSKGSKLSLKKPK